MNALTENRSHPELDPFESRLLDELRRDVAQLARAPRRDRRTGRRIAGLAGVAAASVARVMIIPLLGAAPAYSVSEGNAGTVHVEINRPEDAAGLERALAQHGIRADVTYVPDLADAHQVATVR